VNASSSHSKSDTEPDSDAPRGLVTAGNKKWKRPRVKFKKARVSKTLDPSLPPTPTNITEALHGPQRAEWAAALDHEMDRCSSVDQLNHKLKPVKSKFAFRVTRKPDGSIKYRCRLVAYGYSQIYGVNYNKTFTPIAKWKSVCILLFLVAVYDWNVEGIDVENAYLEAYLDAEIYMNLPSEIYKLNGKSVKVKLIRSLYGLKQAGELWNSLLNSKLLAAAFTRLLHDQCVYVKHDIETNAKTVVVTYVDDIIVTGNSPDEISKTIDYFATEFKKISDLGEISRFIGIDLMRDRAKRTITRSQSPYASQIGAKHSRVMLPALRSRGKILPYQ
jgi:hypothetical protein